MSELATEYEPKNILITGGAGFIASHVVILLAQKYPQFKVVNFDRLDCKLAFICIFIIMRRLCAHHILPHVALSLEYTFPSSLT